MFRKAMEYMKDGLPVDDLARIVWIAIAIVFLLLFYRFSENGRYQTVLHSQILVVTDTRNGYVAMTGLGNSKTSFQESTKLGPIVPWQQYEPFREE